MKIVISCLILVVLIFVVNAQTKHTVTLLDNFEIKYNALKMEHKKLIEVNKQLENQIVVLNLQAKKNKVEIVDLQKINKKLTNSPRQSRNKKNKHMSKKQIQYLYKNACHQLKTTNRSYKEACRKSKLIEKSLNSDMLRSKDGRKFNKTHALYMKDYWLKKKKQTEKEINSLEKEIKLLKAKM